MVDVKISCLVDAQALVGEGPVWDVIEQVLWWTDIDGRALHRFDTRTGRDQIYEIGFRVGCFALRERGGLILAAEHGFWAWDPDSGPPVHLLDVESDRPNNRMNDGCCDRQGRFFASSMNLDTPRHPTGACWQLSADLSVELVEDGIVIGNGMAFSPDGDRFFLADTTVKKIWQYDYTLRSGCVGERMIYADLAAMPGSPDGATVDASGHYWLAAFRGSRINRLDSNGEIDFAIDLPVSAPTRPMFGGKDLDRLFFTSKRIEGEPLSGGLFVIDGIDCLGLPERRFAG